MALSWFKRSSKKSRPLSRSGPTKLWRNRFLPELEPLRDRILPAVTALFTPGTGTLTVLGDAQDNTITLSRDAAGHVLVNGGAVAVQGGVPTVAL